tara:strand:- start:37 stop:306 length:270 start_codon:yes stop_codon:yes gene_type:complete
MLKDKKKSQYELILADLIDGKSITPIDALEKYGCFRLAAVVYNLKEDGYDVNTDIVNNKLSGKKYARYSLNSDTKGRKKEYLTDKVYKF